VIRSTAAAIAASRPAVRDLPDQLVAVNVDYLVGAE
jgi:hypothetical protein